MNARKGEAPYHDYTRCNRLISFRGQWSFATREKTIEGPYASRETAESALQQYIRSRQTTPPDAGADQIPTLRQLV